MKYLLSVILQTKRIFKAAINSLFPFICSLLFVSGIANSFIRSTHLRKENHDLITWYFCRLFPSITLRCYQKNFKIVSLISCINFSFGLIKAFSINGNHLYHQIYCSQTSKLCLHKRIKMSSACRSRRNKFLL